MRAEGKIMLDGAGTQYLLKKARLPPTLLSGCQTFLTCCLNRVLLPRGVWRRSPTRPSASLPKCITARCICNPHSIRNLC